MTNEDNWKKRENYSYDGYHPKPTRFATGSKDTQKGNPTRIIIISLIVLATVGFALSLNESNTVSQPEEKTITLNPSNEETTITPSIKEIKPKQTTQPKKEDIIKTDYREFIDYSLELVNKDRADHGLKPVLLGTNPSAQHHADDLLLNQYFSHWNTKGVKPYVTYTEFDGLGLVKENIAKTEIHCPTIACLPHFFDAEAEMTRHEYGMMYEDEASDWGHRDNILDPFHTHVNFGIAFDNQRFYYVQHFENNMVKWDELSLSEKGILSFKGELPPGFTLENISIFEDPNSKVLTNQILDNEPPFNLGRYDQGILVGMLVKPPPFMSNYIECSAGKLEIHDETNKKNCIEYEIFSEDENGDNYLMIEANVSKWLDQTGLHTVYVNLLNEKSEDYVSVSSITLEYLE